MASWSRLAVGLAVVVAGTCAAAAALGPDADAQPRRTRSRARTDRAMPGLLVPAPTATERTTASIVVIVSVDGLRPDAIGAHTPALARARGEGVMARRAHTIPRSTTLPSHASMLSGQPEDVHGVRWNSRRPGRGPMTVPSVFTVAHAAGLPTSAFVAKDKLEHLVAPGAADVMERPSGACSRTNARALPHLASVAGGLHFLHYAEPDGAGHAHGWMEPAYRQAVMRADRCLGALLRTIAARPDAARAIVIVTSDHGGHGRTHGSPHAVDTSIPWIAWGGAAGRPRTIDDVLSTMDTTATALAALGLRGPRMVGRDALGAR